MFEPTLTNVISLAVVSVLVCVTFVLIVLRSRGKDRRISNRFEVNCEVEFTANGIHYRGMTQDLSLNGLSIKTEHQLGSDTMLDIVIELAGNETSKVKGKGPCPVLLLKWKRPRLHYLMQLPPFGQGISVARKWQVWGVPYSPSHV